MTQDEIIRFAIQCRLVTTGNSDGIYMDALTEFANLVATKEREACAKLVDEEALDAYTFDDSRRWKKTITLLKNTNDLSIWCITTK